MMTRSSSWLMLMLLVAVAGCTARAPRTLTLATDKGFTQTSLDTFLDEHTLAAGQNIRADLLVKNIASSVHIVQIRDREPPHLHAEHDGSVVLLRGEGAIFLDGKPHEMKAGDALVIPRGTPHFFVNLGDDPAIAFVTFAPPYDGSDQVPVPR